MASDTKYSHLVLAADESGNAKVFYSLTHDSSLGKIFFNFLKESCTESRQAHSFFTVK